MSCASLHGVAARFGLHVACRAQCKHAGAWHQCEVTGTAPLPTPLPSPPRHRLLPRRLRSSTTWRTSTACSSSSSPAPEGARNYTLRASRGPLYVAAAALIDETGHVLLSQRSAHDKNNPLKFEFPGGKLEGDESPEKALCRELGEELGIQVQPEDCHPLVFSTAPGTYRSLTLLLFTVRKWAGTPQAREGQPSMRWVSAETLNNEAISMPALDEPLLPAVRAAMRAIGCCASNERVASAAGEANSR